MSKYFDKKFVSDIGQKIIKPNIDEETKNFIISNLVAGNFNLIFDKITPDMSLSFTDSENNSLIHLLLNTNDKLIPEETKIKLLNIFVKKGAPINTYNKQKLTPLHIAINNGNDKIVKLLLEKGANPNAATNNNLLPIHLALRKNIGLCRELIIPKNIGDIEKKNKNELKNALHNKILDIFDRKYFNMLDKIFEDHTEVLKDEEYPDISSNILDLIQQDDTPSEIALKLENKIMTHISNISGRYKSIDKSTIDIDNTINVDNFIRDKLNEKYINHDTKIEELKNNYKKLMYLIDDFDMSLDEMKNNVLKNIIKLIIKYPIHQNIRNNTELLIIFPLDNQSTVNKGRINVRNYTGVINGIKFENVVPGPINVTYDINDTMDQLALVSQIQNYLQIDFSIHFYKKLRSLFYVYNNLNKIVNLVNTIQLGAFDIIDPSDNIISLKSLLLNTIKLNTLIRIILGSFIILKIDKLIGKINGNSIPSLHVGVQLFDYSYLSVSEPVPPGARPGPPVHINQDVANIIRVTTQPKANLASIRKYFNDLYDKYDIPINISNFDSYYENIRNENKRCLDDNIKLLNEINVIKYFINFVRENNLLPAENAKMDNYLIQYFEKKIDISNVSNNLKFKNDPSFLNEFIFPNNEIYGIDDTNNNPREYNQNQNKFKSYKIFRDDEKILINNTFDIFFSNEDVRFYNFILDENNFQSTTPIDIFKEIPDNKEANNYLLRDDTIRNRTVDSDVLYMIRNINIFELYNKIISVTNKKETKYQEINNILPQYELNGFNLELLLSELIKKNINEIVTLLYKYYAMHHSKFILKMILTKININNNFIENDVININLYKLSGINFEVNRDFAIDESENPDNLIFNYNYNYYSNDESNLCYKNKKSIIDTLLKLPTTNYFIKDKDENTILHYLINLENYNLFQSLYNSNYKIFSKLKNTPNKFNKIPINILSEKIHYNNINFYKKKSLDGLIFSEIYSDELFVRLKNNNELSSIIPDNIKSIFNDLYLFFNFENINTDLFNGISIDDYTSLFNYKGKSKLWSLTQINDVNNISDSLYNFIQKRYDIKNKDMFNNEFKLRFYNSIAHVITLHLTNVFFQILKKWLIENNVVILTPKTTTVSNVGVTKRLINSLQDGLFKFDSNYLNQNIGQMIVINLYKIKYNDQIKANDSFSTLKDILKSKLNPLYQSIESSKEKDFIDNMEKIYDYMNTYFDSFNKKLVVFLTNYVKFVELQYNLQKIKELLV